MWKKEKIHGRYQHQATEITLGNRSWSTIWKMQYESTQRLKIVRMIYIYWFTRGQLLLTILKRQNTWVGITWYNLKLQVISWFALFRMRSPINQSTVCNETWFRIQVINKEKKLWSFMLEAITKQVGSKMLTIFKIYTSGGINPFQAFDLSDEIGRDTNMIFTERTLAAGIFGCILKLCKIFIYLTVRTFRNQYHNDFRLS